MSAIAAGASMQLNNYEISGDLQIIDVIANLKLLAYKNDHIDARDEKICIKLVKDKHCLTQAVSGPEILTCKKCGASLPLLDGNTCRYCKYFAWLYDFSLPKNE